MDIATVNKKIADMRVVEMGGGEGLVAVELGGEGGAGPAFA